MIKLPKEKAIATRINPKTIILYGHPKIGKTTAISNLENCLVLDLEEGSEFLDSLKLDIIKISKREKKLPIQVIQEVINSIKKENEKNDNYVYKYIAIDTVGALEELVLPIAKNLYINTPMGKSWNGEDVKTLPQGAGYGYLRNALLMVLNELSSICDSLIILGHVKSKLIEIEGEEIQERALDLIGKMSSILCSQVDSVGYMYRQDNDTKVNFVGSQSLICGGRSPHLNNEQITLISSDEEGKLNVDWSKIFIN